MTDKEQKNGAGKNTCDVLIAESQYLIRESLSSLLSSEPSFVVKAVVSDYESMVRTLSDYRIFLLVISFELHGLKSLTELGSIRKNYPQLRIMVISAAITRPELQGLSHEGINCVMLKSDDREEILEAVYAATRAKKYYSEGLMEVLLGKESAGQHKEELTMLTGTELEIVRLISEGLTTKEIAARKFVSFHTVISHRKNIFRKLGVNSVSELLMYSVKTGLVNTIEYHI